MSANTDVIDDEWDPSEDPDFVYVRKNDLEGALDALDGSYDGYWLSDNKDAMVRLRSVLEEDEDE
jgi:hypothetical protein